MQDNSRQWTLVMAVIAALAVGGCASRTPAPVIERGGAPARPAQASQPQAATVKSGEFHTVKRGETLYSIALEYGLSYRDLTSWNGIDNPNMIRVGQQLRVAPPDGTAVARPVESQAAVEMRPLGGASAQSSTDTLKREPKGGKQPYTEQAQAVAQAEEARREPQAASRPEPKAVEPGSAGNELSWIWPSSGRVIAQFVEGGNKGVDIEGRIGDPIVAAESGKITYAGSGIRGYGNLLILQHANGLSSVYAHNSKLLAREGQQVLRGQKIAELGSSDTDQPKLHFELRRQGKPLDPLKILPPR